MSTQALFLVLFAALLHASWNALVRGASDRAMTMAGVAGTHGIVGAVFILLAPAPARESWPALAVSIPAHYLYYWLMFRAYREGDLSQVYPISRGLSPLLVTIGAFVLAAEVLPPVGLVGVALVSVGIAMLAFSSRGRARAPLWFALALGGVIGAYSVSDGLGIRASGSLMGYMGWLFVTEALVPLFIWGNRRRLGMAMNARAFGMGLLGGVSSVAAYAIALYVMTFAPIGAVSAVREASVIFAAMIGIIVFRERPIMLRLLASVTVACGIGALALV
jgi:drug/metabolite transporter (DMT)-like permease